MCDCAMDSCFLLIRRMDGMAGAYGCGTASERTSARTRFIFYVICGVQNFPAPSIVCSCVATAAIKIFRYFWHTHSTQTFYAARRQNCIYNS